jgi:transcriptional regulator with XRE-family HTH domain
MGECPVVADPTSPEAVALRAFGAKLRAVRQERGMTQEAMAELCGLHWTYIGQIERGRRNVGVLNAIRLADALGVNPAVLLDGLTLQEDNIPALTSLFRR